MGQYWKIVNIDKSQELLNQNCGLKIQEIVWNGLPKQLLELLTVPRLRAYKLKDSCIASARAKQLSSGLVRLPQEIIDHTVGFVVCGTDLIALGLTCSYFFRLLAQRITQAVIADDAPWAGDRLITVGDYAAGVPSTVSEEETSEMVAAAMEFYPEEAGSDYDDSEFTRNPLYSVPNREVSGEAGSYQEAVRACEELDSQQAASQWSRYWSNRIRMLRQHRLTVDEMALLARLLEHPGSDHARPMVLRCVDRQEYVCEAALVRFQVEGHLENGGSTQADLEFYGLGETVYLLTTWSEDYCEGRWAGCRCDITVQQHVNSSWTDVTQEAASLLRNF